MKPLIMKILFVNGSVRENSNNAMFIDTFCQLHSQHEYSDFGLNQLPPFNPNINNPDIPDIVRTWKSIILKADIVIFTTPEYLHNIPSTLKSALEWLSSGGELAGKKVIPITFTPAKPRGEKAMESLCWTLQALNADIKGKLVLDHNDFQRENNHFIPLSDTKDLLDSLFDLF